MVARSLTRSAQQFRYARARAPQGTSALNLFELFTKTRNPARTSSGHEAQRPMISPQYTPFAGNEARRVLRMPRYGYIRAMREGELQQSVHFDGRISMSTSMHSLVDIVRYDVLFGGGWGTDLPTNHVQQCDEWLDALCDLQEECAGFEQLIAVGDHEAIMLHLLPEDVSMACLGAPTTWSAGLAILFDVVSSWCYCSRALSKILVSDRCRPGEGDPLGRRHVPKKHSIDHP